ncbi:hypothetical protein OPV22_017194 [Ensete ventricosum]|uniref:Uncharacterized protein n=1 Tax=Ensete ventricosum TaxID=4639 RepID=A0AAV8R1I0_ENSVE|nr:hypothetical protein OPV22_017194 [Ensete ventricosum]RWW13289.1 hypothetical protein GW17_00022999 [Ensete ventricosum]
MATSPISSSPLLLAAPKCASRASSKLCFDPSLRLTTSARPPLDLCMRKRRFGGDLLKSSRIWRVSTVVEEALPPEEATVEKAQQIIPAAAVDSATSTVISALLLIAFVGLCILTIGVIYLVVQDFLRKREGEKFEKEDAEKKKKKGGKKAKAKARTGPRGFGQKIEEDED